MNLTSEKLFTPGEAKVSFSINEEDPIIKAGTAAMNSFKAGASKEL